MAKEDAKPDWILVVRAKDGEDRTYAGAGWNTEYGGISIKLNPCIQLTDRPDVWLLLKPYEDKKDKTWKKERE